MYIGNLEINQPVIKARYVALSSSLPENFDYPSHKIQSYQDFSVTNLHLHIIIRDNACKKLPDNDVETYNQIGQAGQGLGKEATFNSMMKEECENYIARFYTF